MMRLTEWVDDEHTRARIRNDARDIEAFEAFTRLAQYEDIGTVDELRQIKDSFADDGK